MWNYTNAVHEHFLRPHNAGPMEDANAIGEVGSLACGDALKLYLKINDEGIIEKASFETFGCASAIASSSVLTDMVKGMKAEDALKLTNKEIAEALGGLPKEKMHCSVMGQEALEAAIRQWKGETPVPHAHEEGRLVCKCFGITDAQIIRAIRENGLKTVEEITNYTKAGGACGDCQDQIAEILAAEFKQKPLTELRPVSKPRHDQRAAHAAGHEDHRRRDPSPAGRRRRRHRAGGRGRQARGRVPARPLRPVPLQRSDHPQPGGTCPA